MRRRGERAAKTRRLLVVNCVQLVAAAAVRGVCTKYELVGRPSLQRWSLSVYKAAARRRLQAAAARLFCTRRSGRSARRAARENYSPLISLSLSLQPTSSPLLHPPCCLSTNLQKLKIDQLSQNMKISALKRQNKLCLL